MICMDSATIEIYAQKFSKIDADTHNISWHMFRGNTYQYLLKKALQAYKSLEPYKYFFLWMGEGNTHQWWSTALWRTK